MPTDEELAQQVSGGTASPTPQFQQQVPYRPDFAEFPAEIQPIMQNPQDWILHAPQPEVTQPPHRNEPTGIRGLTPGRWFQFENTRTGQTITMPRPADNTGGRSQQPPVGNQPTGNPPVNPPQVPPQVQPPQVPPVRTPEDQLAEQVSGVVIGPYAGGGTLTMDQFLRAMGSTGSVMTGSQTGFIEGPTVSGGGNTVRSGNVSGSNQANVISRSGTTGGSASGSASQSGSAQSGDATSGQSVFIRR